MTSTRYSIAHCLHWPTECLKHPPLMGKFMKFDSSKKMGVRESISPAADHRALILSGR